MPNTFLTAQEIARASLPILREQLVFPNLCWRDFDTASARRGDVVQVRKPAVFAAKEFTSSVQTQDVGEQSVLCKLDKLADVSVSLTAREMALNVEDFTAQILRPAMVAIAEKVNADGLELYRDVYQYTGQAGTTPDGLDDFANARKLLSRAKAPVSPRYAVWDLDADAAFCQLDAVVGADKSGSTQALREGAIGRIQGLDNYASAAVRIHKAGSLAATGDITVKNAASAGASQLVLTGASMTGTLVRGDLMLVGAEQYVVAEDAEAASNEITVHVAPALRGNAASGVKVTKVGDHTANLAFGQAAFGFISRPLEPAHGAESYVTDFEGLSLRVTLGYDMATKAQMLSVDTLYGYNTLYPELAVRVLG